MKCMERDFFFRKVILNEEVTAISNERCMHIKKLKLVNSSIQETEIFVSEMSSEINNRCSNETCSVESDMDNSHQQNLENNSSLGEDINILNSVIASGQNGEGRDINRGSRNIDPFVQCDDNFSFLVGGIDHPSNFSNRNNRVSKRYELGDVNKIADIDDLDTVHMNRTTRNVDANFARSGNKLGKLIQNYIGRSNQANKNTDCSYSTENFKIPNYKAKKIPPKFHDGRRKTKQNDVENGVTDTSSRRKLDKLKIDDTRDLTVTIAPHTERNGSKSGPNVNISKSDLLKTPRSFEDMKTKKDDDDCKKTEARIKDFQKDNITLSEREDMKNNIKKCRSCFKIFDLEKKEEKVDIEVLSRSVTDLITYFENLNHKEQPNVKSKIKSFESKQGLKKNRILTVDRIFKSNATRPSSTQKDLNFCSKIDSAKRSGVKQREVLLDSDIDNRKMPAEIVPENILPDKNSDDRKEKNEAYPRDNLSDLNTRVNKKSLKIISEQYIPDLSSRKCQNVLTPSTKLSNCTFCKGKCDNFEQAIHRSDDNANIVKEHRFIFSDDACNETEQPRLPYRRWDRSRFTRKHISSIFPRPLKGLDNSQNDEESALNFVPCKRKEYINSLPGIRNQKRVRNRTTYGCLNLSPLVENFIEVRKHEGKFISERKKPKSDKIGCNIKHFIGILLTVVISTVIYKGISENYKLW